MTSSSSVAAPPEADGDGADGVTIRDLTTLEEYSQCVELQEETWGRGFSERVPGAILRVSQKIGGVTAGAFDPTGRMIGFVFGMTGIRDGRPAHWSDMLAVRPEARGQHIGDRLKHYQREQVRALGVDVMLWTCDPLVARNAHFNINRLGARPAEYVENMYGDNTGSTLHGALPTDRFVIAWDLSREYAPSEGVDRPLPGDDAIPLANPLDAAGSPVLSLAAGPMRVQLARDIEKVPMAERFPWRLTVRAAMTTLFARGAKVTRFVRDTEGLPYYVVE
jgi:predicted GNAT superfamily acetyltransferase